MGSLNGVRTHFENKEASFSGPSILRAFLKDETMPRLPRYSPIGIPQHIIQRGNNRQPCFAAKSDYAFYLRCVDDAARAHCVDIHAWVLMTNHVHLLASSRQENGISNLMQSIGRRYVLYFNKRHNRSGTLWEGRFRSCLIDSEHYLLRCYRYIEMNPVRAGMVSGPEQYPWSSYKCNALGKPSRLVVPHEQYLLLGRSPQQRAVAYQQICHDQHDPDPLEEIRQAINSGMALGSDHFKGELELLLNRRVRPGRRGRRGVMADLNISNGF